MPGSSETGILYGVLLLFVYGIKTWLITWTTPFEL